MCVRCLTSKSHAKCEYLHSEQVRDAQDAPCQFWALALTGVSRCIREGGETIVFFVKALTVGRPRLVR